MTYGRQPRVNEEINWVTDEDGNVIGPLTSGDGKSAPNTMVLLGDSITNNSNVNNGGVGTSNVTTQYQTSDIGWWTWTNIQLGGAFKVIRNSGRAGDTTGDMLGRLATDVLAYSPAWVLVAGGINDRQLGGQADLGYDYTVGNLQTIVERCNAAGAKVILATILPNNFLNSLGAGNIKIEMLLRVNDWIRRYCEGKPNVICLDVFSSIYDQATLCDGVAGSFNTPTDKTHPLVAAAWRIGTDAARALAGVVKPRPVIASLGGIATITNPYGNLVRYSTMSGTTGTLPATYTPTGTVPDGWWLQNDGAAVANAGHTVVMTRPARTDYPNLTWWRSAVSWTTAQAAVTTFTHRLQSAAALAIPAGVNAGDIIDCALELQYSGVTNAGPLTVEFVARQGTTDLLASSFTYGQSSTTPTPPFAGVVTTNGMPLPVGADNIMVRIQCRNLAATAGGYTLDIGRGFVGKRM